MERLFLWLRFFFVCSSWATGQSVSNGGCVTTWWHPFGKSRREHVFFVCVTASQFLMEQIVGYIDWHTLDMFSYFSAVDFPVGSLSLSFFALSFHFFWTTCTEHRRIHHRNSVLVLPSMFECVNIPPWFLLMRTCGAGSHSHQNQQNPVVIFFVLVFFSLAQLSLCVSVLKMLNGGFSIFIQPCRLHSRSLPSVLLSSRPFFPRKKEKTFLRHQKHTILL